MLLLSARFSLVTPPGPILKNLIGGGKNFNWGGGSKIIFWGEVVNINNKFPEGGSEINFRGGGGGTQNLKSGGGGALQKLNSGGRGRPRN